MPDINYNVHFLYDPPLKNDRIFSLGWRGFARPRINH